MLTLAKATDDHVEYIAPRLRQADIEEMEAFSGMTPLDGLRYCKASSHTSYTIMDGATPVVLYGGTPDGRGKANVWMMATDGLLRRSRQFIRQSRLHLDLLHEELNSSFLYAYADPRNTLHQVWLAYSGFRLGGIMYVRDHPFITVTRIKCV